LSSALLGKALTASAVPGLCLTPDRVAEPDPRRKGKGGIQGGLTYVGESQKEGPAVGDRRKEGLTSYPCLQIQDLKERLQTYP